METKEQEQKKASLKGKILHVSLCPHGTIEGMMVNNTFVKLPPHHNFEDKVSTLKVGDEVQIEGEEISGGPHPVLHHVVVKRGEEVLFDHDKVTKKEKPLTEPKREPFDIQGKIIALGVKPKGELDRILLSGDISVHLPKDHHLELSAIQIGHQIRVHGEGTKFERGTFLRADKIRDEHGRDLPGLISKIA